MLFFDLLINGNAGVKANAIDNTAGFREEKIEMFVDVCLFAFALLRFCGGALPEIRKSKMVG